MSKLTKTSEQQTKKSIAYEQIRSSIINQTLPPGTPLVERTICEALSTSRTPVREAIQQLAAEGLVDILPGNVALVSDITYDKIVEIYNIREVLEGLAARTSALLIGETQLQELGTVLECSEQTDSLQDPKTFHDCDLKFHNIIVSSCRSSMLMHHLKIIEGHVKRITWRGSSEYFSEATLEHWRIYEALCSHDPIRAEEAMRVHIRRSKQNHLADTYHVTEGLK